MSGSEREYFVIESCDWVNVIALTTDEQVVLIEQFRHGFGEPALEIPGGGAARSRTVADAGLGHLAITALNERLRSGEDLDAAVDRALGHATADLIRNVASADGLQHGGRPGADVHHFANVLYNNMRGGMFPANHDAPVPDFLDFLDLLDLLAPPALLTLLALLARKGQAHNHKGQQQQGCFRNIARDALHHFPWLHQLQRL